MVRTEAGKQKRGPGAHGYLITSATRAVPSASSAGKDQTISNRDHAGKSPGQTGEPAYLQLKTALVVPTLNAGESFAEWLEALKWQSFVPERLLLIDSSSNDNTVETARAAGFDIHIISRAEFNHGGTRQRSVEILAGYDLIVFMTQDAVLADRDSIANLLKWFDDPKVGAAYGRQLPRRHAEPIEAHARLFNYPHHTEIKGKDDIPRLGIKTAFISNSFAAYRREVLLAAGGFPSHTIQNEDTYTASRMILQGWKVAYVSDATVYHSHPFRICEEFRRYFDIGVFHARAPWIRREFGHAGGEGLKYVKSELTFLLHNRPVAIPSAMVRTAAKLVGFKLGNHERMLPMCLKRKLSVNKRYWGSTADRRDEDIQ